MRHIIVLVTALVLWVTAGGPLAAQDWEDRRVFGTPTSNEATLRILSSTDTVFLAPIIEGFIRANPDWAVEYLVTGTADADMLFRAAPDRYDILISSAMDLQLKLVNDGYAHALDGVEHPEWAMWRQSLFAFTSEPAAIVLNRAAFKGRELPQTRQELITALRERSDYFTGRVGTYDVRRSGLGYLFATQDARVSETYWRLMEVMGALNTRLYCCSGDMIDDVAEGRILAAYNVLGSYAAARQEEDDRFAIIQPSDFPTMMMRTGFVSVQSVHMDEAEAFLRHLVAAQTGQGAQAATSPLPPLAVSADGSAGAIIPLDPSLMAFQDRLKRRTFLEEWENAVIQ
ncbi:ABC transporter substrate-binding protein [Aliiroseovarius sp. KMU-50]|uniref:ABC transporter substrate-binding protein n=1 Tax=Aliiroseovarius salicola TaxID=3009082 RepID=A0ABT4W541_9RHOB|nr:ABC transporter substrate-binding protein [Aliiroseovarius sp. KMU-50]MDA5095621.1 ABC transporter substrate-binding protein [Aliiroseovarius sp. KMU-50]